MSNQEITDEAKRLRAFIDLLKMTNADFAKSLNKTPPMISKYCSGVVKIPIDLVKEMHVKYKLSYWWFFNGVLPEQIDAPEKRLAHDIGYLIISIKSMEAQMEQMNTKINKLTRDLYAQKD